MIRIATRVWWSAALAGALALVAPPGRAGTEPLYRHALEQWPADLYQVIVFHHEPASSDARELVDLLLASPRHGGANVAVSVVDVAEPMAEPMQTLWAAQPGVEPPWVVVTAPGAAEGAPPVWAGSLRPETVSALLDSPARRKIGEGLLGGDAAVWVLLECGDTVRDEAAVDLLASELKRQELKLSSRDSPTNAAGGLSRPAWRVVFSLVRVTRNDPAEEFLVSNLLLGASLTHIKPAAFPVFGRGRMLPALAGKRLNADSIEATCRFVAGACTNKTKAGNSGRDLLLSTRWDSPPVPSAPASGTSRPVAPALALPLVSSASASNPPSPIASTTAPAQTSAADSSMAGSYLGLGLIVAVVTGAVGFVAFRSPRRPSS
jgi:hypothetical protein